MVITVLTFFLYALVYSVAILVFKMANDVKNEIERKWILVFGIFFLAMFGSIRDASVGTDTAETISIYFVEQYKRNIILNGIGEVLHGDIIYFVISQIIHFLHFGSKAFLFVLQVCTLIPVVLCAYIKRNRIPIHITMFIFLLLYYQLTFNWIRQSIASAFILLTVVYVQNKLIKKAVFASILSILFHSSAIIGLLLLACVFLFIRIKHKFLRIILGGFLIIICIFLSFQWEKLAALGINYGILPESYSGYLRVFSGQTTVESWFLVGKRTYIDYILRIILVMIPIFIPIGKIPLNERQNIYYYKIVAIIGLIIYSYVLLSMHSTYGNRISYCIEYIQILNLGMCYLQSPKRRGVIPLRNMIIIITILAYNIWLYYVLGWHDTVPFIFAF